MGYAEIRGAENAIGTCIVHFFEFPNDRIAEQATFSFDDAADVLENDPVRLPKAHNSDELNEQPVYRICPCARALVRSGEALAWGAAEQNCGSAILRDLDLPHVGNIVDNEPRVGVVVCVGRGGVWIYLDGKMDIDPLISDT